VHFVVDGTSRLHAASSVSLLPAAMRALSSRSHIVDAILPAG
jgi:hypothetical protein